MNLPSREECEGWDQAQVAFFLYKNKMQECAATVNKLKINGHRLLGWVAVYYGADENDSQHGVDKVLTSVPCVIISFACCFSYQLDSGMIKCVSVGPRFSSLKKNLSDTELSKFSLIHQPQLQKIVQDIKKNDGSLLNKLRRLKSKPIPKVPARDYRDDDQLSEPDYDNDTYEDPHEDHDDSYEPPPRGHHQNFTTTPAASYPKGEYLDNRRNQPQRPPRKPVRPSKGSKQLPPEPTGMGSDDEDYINPDGNDDDNYIEPEENPPSNPMMHGMSKVGKNSPMLSTPLPERPPSPDVYEVPDQEENSMSPASRLCPIPTTQSHTLLPKPSPRITTKISPPTEPTGDDEYEVCDPHDSTSDKAAEGPPPLKPKPVPRERSPKPPVRPRPDLKPREFESRTLPVMPTEQKTSPKAFSLDFHKRPKIPLPHFTPPVKPADKGSISSENGSLDQDKDADVYRKSWYASTCDRKTADDVLFRANKDGAFMVRKSSGQDAQQPYTLVVFYNGRVYNIPIRFIPTTQQYALGREKRGEEYFSSVSHIIENHQRNPLVLIDSQSNTKDATKLCFPVKP